MRKYESPARGKFDIKRYMSYKEEMLETLKTQYRGEMPQEEQRELIISLIEGQEEGFWKLIDSEGAPGDARIDFILEPTYIALAIMMSYCCQYPEEAKEISGIREALKQGLEVSSKAGLHGQGYEAFSGKLYAIKVFSMGRVWDFIKIYKDICPAFSIRLQIEQDRLYSDLRDGKCRGMWGEDYREQIEEAIRLIQESRCYVEIFICGEELKGQRRNEGFLKDACYIGKACLWGYKTDKTEGFQGISRQEGKCLEGEVFSMPVKKLEEIEACHGSSVYKLQRVETCKRAAGQLRFWQSALAWVYTEEEKVNSEWKK